MNRELRIIAYNRPHYLQHVLNSLVKVRGLERYHLIASIDQRVDGTYNHAVITMLQKITDDIRLRPRFDCNRHLRVNWVEAFEGGADFVFILEDDLCLAEDTLEFCESHEGMLGYHHRVKLISPYNIEHIKNSNRPIEDWKWGIDAFCIRNLYRPWGNYIGHDQIGDILPYWSESFDSDTISWDILFRDRIMKPSGWYTLFPLVTRVRNIGNHGKHQKGKLNIHELISDDLMKN